MEPLPSIHIHIERIVVDGLPFTTADAGPLHAELTAEILRALTGEIHLGSVGAQHLSALPAAAADVSSYSHAAFGREIASTLRQSLSPVLATPSDTFAP